MSAGRFQRYFYELNSGDVASIRLQPETITAWNPSATGPANLPVSAKVSNGNRQFGIKPRTVSLNTGDAPPTGYAANSILRVPVLTESAWDAIITGNTLTYLTVPMTVVGKNPERVR